MRDRAFRKLLLTLSCWGLGFLLICLPMSYRSAMGQEVAATSDARLIESLRSFIPHAMRLTGTTGLNLALARRGKVIWEEGFGYADLEKKTRMTAQTVMHSGSMGKLYTAVAVMQLVERGSLGLDDPINKYLTEFKVVNALGEREITVRDLLTHRSGLSTNAANSTFTTPQPLGTHLKASYARKHHEMYDGALAPLWSAKVGEKYQYSNLGLATLGYLVEVANQEKQSFSAYVQKHIIDPLGMKSSQYPPVQNAAHVRPEIFARFSTGYARFGPVYIPTPAIYFADYPAGTVVTTPGDHLRLLLALRTGTLADYQLLKPETARLMLTPQVKLAEGVAVGLIVNLRNLNQPDYYFGHAGLHMYGWSNDSRVYPEQDFGVTIATNNWPVVLYGDSRAPKFAHNLIAEFISSWLKHEKTNVERVQPSTSWAWKTSYVIGLIMVNRLRGQLGIKDKITREMIEAMATGARVNSELENGASVWDPAGFRAGVEDLLGVENTPAGYRAFLASARLRVAPEELELLYRELEGRGDNPFQF